MTFWKILYFSGSNFWKASTGTTCFPLLSHLLNDGLATGCVIWSGQKHTVNATGQISQWRHEKKIKKLEFMQTAKSKLPYGRDETHSGNNYLEERRGEQEKKKKTGKKNTGVWQLANVDDGALKMRNGTHYAPWRNMQRGLLAKIEERNKNINYWKKYGKETYRNAAASRTNFSDGAPKMKCSTHYAPQRNTDRGQIAKTEEREAEQKMAKGMRKIAEAHWSFSACCISLLGSMALYK